MNCSNYKIHRCKPALDGAFSDFWLLSWKSELKPPRGHMCATHPLWLVMMFMQALHMQTQTFITGLTRKKIQEKKRTKQHRCRQTENFQNAATAHERLLLGLIKMQSSCSPGNSGCLADTRSLTKRKDEWRFSLT